jgi:hypothetical protein
MIDCPKCKFRQPKDQYCANCGIDMFAYKSTSPEKSKSIFTNGSFLVFMLVCVASLIAYFIANSDHPQNWVRKISYSSKSSSLISQKQNSTQTLNETNPSTDVQVVPSSEANMNALATESNTNNLETVDSENISAEVKFTFAEISRNDLAAWINESQRLELLQLNNDFSAGILPNFKSKFQSSFKELKMESKKIFLKKPQALLFGKTIDETSEFVGFQANLDLKSVENQTTKGHLNITKISRYEKIELPIEFELQKDALFFINWKTAMSGFENENLLFTTPPFQILKSVDFLNQKTEFIILIEPL